MSYNNHLPNIKLINQDNKKVLFHDLINNGKLVILNMFYAKCNVKCLPSGKILARANKLLGNFTETENIHFVSITLASESDTLEDLKNFRYLVGAEGLKNTGFYTGDPKDIDFLRRRLGMYYDDEKQDKDISQHKAHYLLINNTIGQVKHIRAYKNPMDIARFALQYSTKHLLSQTGCYLLKDLRYDLLEDDELYENVASLNTRYTIPFLRKDIQEKLSVKGKEQKGRITPLENDKKRNKNIKLNYSSSCCCSQISHKNDILSP